MRERGLSFEEALNESIRQGAVGTPPKFRTETASMGRATVNLDRALQVAGELEDDELVRKMRAGS